MRPCLGPGGEISQRFAHPAAPTASRICFGITPGAQRPPGVARPRPSGDPCLESCAGRMCGFPMTEQRLGTASTSSTGRAVRVQRQALPEWPSCAASVVTGTPRAIWTPRSGVGGRAGGSARSRPIAGAVDHVLDGVRRRAREDSPLRRAIVGRCRPSDLLEQLVGDGDPAAGCGRLPAADAEPAAGQVDVAPFEAWSSPTRIPVSASVTMRAATVPAQP